MVDSIKTSNSLTELHNILGKVDKTTMGKSGGRKIIVGDKEQTLNQAIKKYLQLCRKADYSNAQEINSAVGIADHISLLENSAEYKKGLTISKKINLKFRQFFGNIFGYRSYSRTPEKLKSLGFQAIYRHHLREYHKLNTSLNFKILKFGFNNGDLSGIKKDREEIDQKWDDLLNTAYTLDFVRSRKLESLNDKIQASLDKAIAKLEKAQNR